MGSSSSTLSFGVLLGVVFVLAILVGLVVTHSLSGVSITGLS